MSDNTTSNFNDLMPDNGRIRQQNIISTGVKTNNTDIRNLSANRTVDKRGVVSSNNFNLGQATLASLFTTSSLTLVDVTGMSLTFTINANSTRVMFSAVVIGFQTKAGLNGSGGNVWILLDGLYQRQLPCGGKYNPFYSNNIGSEYSAWTQIVTLSAGTHTVKMAAFLNDATAICRVEEAILTYVVLGT